MARTGANIGNPAGIIAGLMTRGLSSTAALREFREAGGAMRTQSWYRAWGEVRSAFGNREAMADLDYDITPSDDLFTDWSAGRAGTKATQLEILVRDTDTGLIYRSRYTYMSDDAMPPQAAIDAALDEWEQASAESETGIGQVILGAVVVGLYSMTGRL